MKRKGSKQEKKKLPDPPKWIMTIQQLGPCGMPQMIRRTEYVQGKEPVTRCWKVNEVDPDTDKPSKVKLKTRKK